MELWKPFRITISDQRWWNLYLLPLSLFQLWWSHQWIAMWRTDSWIYLGLPTWHVYHKWLINLRNILRQVTSKRTKLNDRFGETEDLDICLQGWAGKGPISEKGVRSIGQRLLSSKLFDVNWARAVYVRSVTVEWVCRNVFAFWTNSLCLGITAPQCCCLGLWCKSRTDLWYRNYFLLFKNE